MWDGDRYTEVHYILKNVGESKTMAFMEGDLYTEVTVKAGLTVYQ